MRKHGFRLLAALVLIGPAAAASTACTARGPETAQEARQSGVVASGSSLPHFEVSISRFANLVHWVDNLAGTSMGKTIRAYRMYWTNRFGMPDAKEQALLAAWTAIRFKNVPTPPVAILNPRGCLPQSDAGPDFRARFLLRSYEADSIDSFVASMGDDLTSEESAKLREILEAFEPKFDAIWKDMTFLPLFKKRFENYLAKSQVRPFLAEVARFFGVDPGLIPSGRIHLMGLPAESGTHAQANGRDLLMEIRPNDTPMEQIQVICHESSHYFWQSLPADRDDDLARQVYAASRSGPVIWRLLRESLPTAIGQGLAEARLDPPRFGMNQPWYHIEENDRFAKEIYPAVAEAFRDGRGIDQGVLQEIARIGDASPTVRRAVARDYLSDVFFAVGEGMTGSYRRIRAGQPLWSAWTYRASDPEAASFLERYRCLTGVILLSPSDLAHLADLPEILRPPDAGSGGRPPAAPARSSIQAERRKDGGVLFYLSAASPEDIPRVADAFMQLREVPDEPFYLPGAPAASPAGSP